jgi:glycosyltransferase involved in cell wall biosynthesis
MEPEWARLFAGAGVAVRLLPGCEEEVEPASFARPRAVELALRADPPDVVIAHEFTAPVYTALRVRQAGLAFDRTLFVTFCHGTRRWVKEVTRNERVSADVLREAALERASVELADVAVSPSAYLAAWMRDAGWQLPERTYVVPYVTRSQATGEASPEPVPPSSGRVERLAFFGRLEERKGVRPFLAGLNVLAPELLEGVELEFIGKTTKHWSRERVESKLSEDVRRALQGISFETELDQHEALARLSRPGTLAVMPALGDNSPNTVYECLERGIPFAASAVGGIPELIAPEDRDRVLFEPTAEGVEGTLRRALSQADALRPVRPAFDADMSCERWAEIVVTRPHEPTRPPERTPVDVVVVHRGSREGLARCLAALAAQRYAEIRVIVADSRETGIREGSAPWVVFLDEHDVPAEELVGTLVSAQAASGADVVTCGVYVLDDDVGGTVHLFSGEPGGLGVLANGYGNTALIRRSLLDGAAPTGDSADADWPLLARLSASGARVVSVPAALVTRTARPGTLERQPSDALLVVQELERALPESLQSLARLAAGLAAEAQHSTAPPPGGRATRAVRRLASRLR